MSLITPVARDSDVVFPGEGWFFYWKTSSSLWKQKIEQYHNARVLVVPLNWSFHSETGEDVDFAENRPETNLKKLVDIAHELNKTVVFLLPLTPAPFISNGGVPHLLARSMSKGKDGLAYTILDAESNLYKIYSFFNPNIFKAWSRFVASVASYFSQQGIACDIKGLVSGHYDGESFCSYLDDESITFENSFARYFSVKKAEMQTEGEFQIESAEEELILRKEFTRTIYDLYYNFARKTLAANWNGVLKSAFLGGALKDNLQRMGNSWDSESYINDFFLSLSEGVVPSSVLLPMACKKGAFSKILGDLVDYNYQKSIYCDIYQDEEEGVNLRALSYFLVADEVDLLSNTSLWERYHFWDYILSEFRWSFKKSTLEEMNFSEESLELDKIYCFLGETLDEKSFRNVLKVFMQGGKVILDRNLLDRALLQRMEGFFVENSLQVEKINYVTEVHNVTLGAGRLVIFDGDKLTGLSEEKQMGFWSKLIDTFSLLYLPIKAEDDVEVFWRTRMSTPSELNYEEVRRLGVYNPTSYRKKVNIAQAKNFALKKVIDEMDVHIQTKNNEIDIELQPGGSVSLEFGVFS